MFIGRYFWSIVSKYDSSAEPSYEPTEGIGLFAFEEMTLPASFSVSPLGPQKHPHLSYLSCLILINFVIEESQ